MRVRVLVAGVAVAATAPLALAAVVEGLGPATPLVRSACRDVADTVREQRLRLTVYCPPLVPHAFAIRREWAGSIGGSKSLSGGYAISFASRKVGGANGWGGHWTFDVGQPALLRRLRHPFPQRPEQLLNLRGRDVGIYRIPADIRSFYAGHVVYAWQESGLRFHMTVHGYDWEPRLRRMTSALMAAVDRCRTRPAATGCASVVLNPTTPSDDGRKRSD